MVTDLSIFLLGLAGGSFLNVLIHRLPRGESIVRPGSHCPKCKCPVAWFDNIPLASFLLLRGKCRNCRARIPLRYPLVELASGLIWYWTWKGSGGSPYFWIDVAFLSILLVVCVTDLETGLIPDRMTLPGAVVGLAASFVYPHLHLTSVGWTAILRSLFGLIAGGALIFLTGALGNWFFQKETLGGGDVKFLAMAGSFLGWEKVMLTFFTAPLLALPFGLYLRWVEKEETIPYGPFLAMACAIQFFYGDRVWRFFIYGV